VLGNRDTHAISVDFLKRIRAYEDAWYLASDTDERNRVQLGISDGRQDIGRSRARGGETHRRFSAGTRQPLRNEASPLFVAGEHMMDGTAL
jgi:hypothetical protein